MKIINIIPHVPNYQAYENSPKPLIYWNINPETWVGIWGYDWPDLLGAEILKIAPHIQFQVWQPDTRADKMYEATLDSHVQHKLFPVENREGSVFRSPAMISALKKEIAQGAVLNLNDLDSAYEILEELALTGVKDFPVVLTCHGSTRMPIGRLRKLKRFWRIPGILNQHRLYKRMLRKVDVISEQHDYGIKEYKKYFKGLIVKTTMGCDFDFWKPKAEHFDKKHLEQLLGCDCESKKVFFNACNFSPVKQLESLIKGFTALKRPNDYLLVLVGHGAPDYESYLKEVASELIQQDAIRFLPYTRGEALRTLYWSADYFINTSVTEGGPVSLFQALACGLPVIATQTGAGADFLNEQGCGYLLPVHSEDHWQFHLQQILDGAKVTVAPVSKAFEQFSWPKVAQRFIQVYTDLWQKYHSS